MSNLNEFLVRIQIHNQHEYSALGDSDSAYHVNLRCCICSYFKRYAGQLPLTHHERRCNEAIKKARESIDGLGPAWEANDRMPAIVRWKGGGVPEGETSSEIVSTLDVLPTVLSMIGKDIPIGIEVDGIDVTDDFLGQAQSLSSSLLLQNEGKAWWLQFQYNVYSYRMAVKSMMRHVLY
eukprot:scaffold1835_cov95-Skeletonema_dohrnii-CCMP3373.AAC.1